MLTLGLSHALRQQGKVVQLFKKGPDYIDPMWHRTASGRDSYNLDSYMMGDDTCLRSFLDHSSGSTLNIIEGNLGLHDGMDLEGENSSAALAKLLKAPVILAIDARGMNRNAAAIVYGLQHFDPEVTIGGVVLNQVRSSRQAEKMIQAIEKYCAVPVLGAIPIQEKEFIGERHLGLITPKEVAEGELIIESMGRVVMEHVDLEQVLNIAHSAPFLDPPRPSPNQVLKSSGSPNVTIGVAFDPAFCFYYQDNLDALKNMGANLVFFDTMHDEELPEVDGLFLAGGFPESFPHQLSANKKLRDSIAKKIEAGLPTYAECGGMMYLTQALLLDGNRHEMVGVIPAEVEFTKRPVGYGYVDLSPNPTNKDSSWLHLSRPIRGHEFHYSRLVNLETDLTYLYDIHRGAGMGDGKDGILYKNMIASYTHLHASAVPEWAESFVAISKKWKKE